MSVQETTVYVLKPYKASAKRKSSSQIPASKEMLDDPAPEVVFEGRSFCFSGIFVFTDGDRNQCEAAVRARGGRSIAKEPTTSRWCAPRRIKAIRFSQTHETFARVWVGHLNLCGNSAHAFVTSGALKKSFWPCNLTGTACVKISV
jgi:hypothetical protein